ncbi:hypothetical protein A2U01_0054690, partial [Trifolium medium]|nr:hypothetical protein [Trifolium medium]
RLSSQWNEEIVEVATWQNDVKVKSQISRLRLEDRSLFQGDGIDRTLKENLGPNSKLAHQLSKPIMDYYYYMLGESTLGVLTWQGGGGCIWIV